MNVGDYVRTKWGNIYKILNVNDFREPSMKYGVNASYLKDIIFIGDEDILKSSSNIIDLIEVGDYVNGVLINIKTPKGVYHGAYDDRDEVHITKVEDIKSIVTYEQFQRMKYKVGKE